MLKVGKYLVLDLETEGLDPKIDGILEVGAISVGPGLETVGDFWYVCIGTERPFSELSPFIQGMHRSSGLMSAIAYGAYVPSEAKLDFELSEWIREQGYKPGEVMLAGNSIDFDRGFIRARLPLTSSLLSHRVLDISALHRELTEISPVSFPPLEGQMPHRALQDARIELENWRRIRSVLKLALGPVCG